MIAQDVKDAPMSCGRGRANAHDDSSLLADPPGAAGAGRVIGTADVKDENMEAAETIVPWTFSDEERRLR